MIRLLVLALGLAALTTGSAGAQPKAAPVTDGQMKRWAAKAFDLKPEDQEAAFRAKLGELNPKLDTSPRNVKVVADKEGVVCEVRIPGEYAEDIRPVALFRDLERLDVHAPPGPVSKVADVSCLRGLTKLKELNVGFTSVADLSPLAGLPVDKLCAGMTAVKDVRALKKMPLTVVELPAGVAAKDLAVLAGKPLREFVTEGSGPDTAKEVKAIFGDAKLDTYRIGRSNLDTLEPLANMPLVYLGLGDAPKLKSLAPLKGCTTLRVVGFAKAPLVTDLTPLAGKPITRLKVAHCPGVRDIAPVKNMPDLVHLTLTDIRADDLTPLADLKKLSRLEVGEMQVKSLKPLADLPQLWHLELPNTAVADKDFTPITRLRALRVLVIDVTPATAPLVKKIATLETLNGKPFANPK